MGSEGYCEHPDPIVETATLARVTPPEPTYVHSLDDLLGSGRLSTAQLEAVVYACMRFEQRMPGRLLPDPGDGDGAAPAPARMRCGFFLGDGAGVGKGRQIAALIREVQRAGVRRVLWLSVSQDLRLDAQRDLADAGASATPLWPAEGQPLPGAAAPLARAFGAAGVLFTTYSMLIGRSSDSRANDKTLREWRQELRAPKGDAAVAAAALEAGSSAPGGAGRGAAGGRGRGGRAGGGRGRGGGRFTGDEDNKLYEALLENPLRFYGEGSRMRQIVTWLKGTQGDDDYGQCLIVLDECHKAKNLLVKGSTQTGMAVEALQLALPEARVLFSSATGATDPENLAYMVRLGHPGFCSMREMVKTLHSSGLGALELYSLSLKAMGAYLCRTLSYHGATFEMETVQVEPEQRVMYDRAADFWQLLVQVFTSLPPSGDRERDKHRYAMLWATHQRFFRQMLMAGKVKRCVELARKAVANGMAVVIGLQATGEAAMDSRLANEAEELQGFISCPQEQLRNFINTWFSETSQAGENVREETKNERDLDLLLHDVSRAVKAWQRVLPVAQEVAARPDYWRREIVRRDMVREQQRGQQQQGDGAKRAASGSPDGQRPARRPARGSDANGANGASPAEAIDVDGGSDKGEGDDDKGSDSDYHTGGSGSGSGSSGSGSSGSGSDFDVEDDLRPARARGGAAGSPASTDAPAGPSAPPPPGQRVFVSAFGDDDDDVMIMEEGPEGAASGQTGAGQRSAAEADAEADMLRRGAHMLTGASGDAQGPRLTSAQLAEVRQQLREERRRAALEALNATEEALQAAVDEARAQLRGLRQQAAAAITPVKPEGGAGASSQQGAQPEGGDAAPAPRCRKAAQGLQTRHAVQQAVQTSVAELAAAQDLRVKQAALDQWRERNIPRVKRLEADDDSALDADDDAGTAGPGPSSRAAAAGRGGRGRGRGRGSGRGWDRGGKGRDSGGGGAYGRLRVADSDDSDDDGDGGEEEAGSQEDEEEDEEDALDPGRAADDTSKGCKGVRRLQLVLAKRLLAEVAASLELPPTPLDWLIKELGGPDAVAEMTGRKSRLAEDAETGRVQQEDRSDALDVARKDVNITERDHFMAGRKLVAVISDAASTGVSLQADRRAANRRRRYHITLELPWSADKAVQQFGRSHRSNQLSAPIYCLLVTACGGEFRVCSSVAKRLQSLGALTQGDRRAVGASENIKGFDVSNMYGKGAVRELSLQAMRSDGHTQPLPGVAVPAIPEQYLSPPAATARGLQGEGGPSFDAWLTYMNRQLTHAGLLTKAGHDKMSDANAPVERFLNRLLGLRLGDQNAIFDFFFETQEALTRTARMNGTYDHGIVTLGAASARVLERRVVHKEAGSGAEAHYVRVEAQYSLTWTAAQDAHRQARGLVRRVRAREAVRNHLMRWTTFAKNTKTNGGKGQGGTGRPMVYLVIPRCNMQRGTVVIASNPRDQEYVTRMPSCFRGQTQKAGWVSEFLEPIDAEEAEQLWTFWSTFLQTNCIHGVDCGFKKRRGVCKAGMPCQEHHFITGAVIPIWSQLYTVVKASGFGWETYYDREGHEKRRKDILTCKRVDCTAPAAAQAGQGQGEGQGAAAAAAGGGGDKVETLIGLELIEEDAKLVLNELGHGGEEEEGEGEGEME